MPRLSTVLRLSRPGTSRLLSAAVVGTVAALLLVGCTTPDAAPPDTRSETPATGPDAAATPPGSTPCGLLDEATLTQLLGDAPSGVEVVVPGSVIRACQFGDVTSHGVQVARVPAGLWAQQLPSIAAAALALPEGSIDTGMRDQLVDAADAVEAGREVSAEEACGYFSDLLELAGQGPDSTLSVSYLPDLASAVAVNAQQCEDGIYSSLLVAKEDIASDPLIVDQLSNLVRQLE